MFIFVPLLLSNLSEGSHVQAFLGMQTLHLLFLGHLTPFNIRELNFLEISIEALFMILGYAMITFTSFNPDKNMQYKMGQWFITTVIVLIIINIILMINNAFLEGKQK
jgi:hypothetical protein